MNWRLFLGVIMIAGSGVWYYYYVRPDEIQQAAESERQATSTLEANQNQEQKANAAANGDADDQAAAGKSPTYGFNSEEISAIQAKSGSEIAVEIRKSEFRRFPEKQMMVKEILAREIAKGDTATINEMMRQIDTGLASESSDLFEAMTMSTSFVAAKMQIDLAFNATNEEVRKRALGAVSHLYKSRGTKRPAEEVAKIEQYLVAALGRADLSDREFAAIIQTLAGFGTAFGVQTIIELWDSATGNRQEIIASEIKSIFHTTAVAPLSACTLSHKQLWRSCGLALAMIGSEDSIAGIFAAITGNAEKKAESLIWFQSVNKIPAIKMLLAESNVKAEQDKEYFSQVKTLAENLLESIQPTTVQ